MDVRRQRGTQILCILALVAAATALASAKFRYPATGIDDANIFFVYAHRLSAGEGFVFNPGGEKVEGFTSALWVLICSAAIAIARHPERILLVFSVLLVSLTIFCCLQSFLFRRSNDGTGTGLMWASGFVTLLLLDSRYVVWNTLTLMETALWGSVLTIATVLIVDERSPRKLVWVFAGIVALMVMTRPEALVWGPAACGLFYLKHSSISGRRHALRAVTPSLMAYVLTASLLTMFRLIYFGLPLPNTYYAKVSPSLAFNIREGTNYLWGYFSSGPITFGCLLMLIVSFGHLLKVRFSDRNTLTLSMLAVIGLMVPVLTGGDHFEGFRFYQSVYPILLLVSLNCMRFIIPRYIGMSGEWRIPQLLALGGIASVLAMLITGQIVEAVQFGSGLQIEFDIAAAGRKMGTDANVLFEHVRPRPEIGTITVGGLQYAYDGPVVDLMGLNNTKMALNGGERIGFRAHAAFEKDTFYELKPTIIVPLVQHSLSLTTSGEQAMFVDSVLKGLLQENRFQNMYRLAEVRKTTRNGHVRLAGWYDREFLTDLARSGEYMIVIEDTLRPE